MAAPKASTGRAPRPEAIPASAPPAEDAATFQPARATKTWARRPGGAYRSRAASVAVTHGAVRNPTSANAATANG